VPSARALTISLPTSALANTKLDAVNDATATAIVSLFSFIRGTPEYKKLVGLFMSINVSVPYYLK
jgi:hypothetical protein